jgi:hypothetical protein
VVGASKPLWTDYAAAIGAIVGVLVALVGILIAGVALYVALVSARDSARSADLAEETSAAAERIAKASESTMRAAARQQDLAELAHRRIEAERARRPVVDQLYLSEVSPRPGEEDVPAALRIGFTNSGDLPLRDAILTILLDPGSAPELTDRWGDSLREGRLDETTERWPGVDGLPRAFDYLVRTISVPVGVSSVQYVRVARRGRFAVRVKLFHADLDAGGPWTDAAIVVNVDGRTTVVDLTAEAPSLQAKGRLSEFSREASA